MNDKILLSESCNIHRGTHIREHEEVTQVSPSVVRKTTVYEAQRTLGTGQPVIGATSTGFRTIPTVSTSTSTSTSTHATQQTNDEPIVEEKYEVTVSAYDESGLRIVSTEHSSGTSIMDEEYGLIFFSKTFT